MTLDEIVQELRLTWLTDTTDRGQTVPTSGYAADLLSCVMVGAQSGGLWVTLQAHSNIVAIGALLDLCAIVITEGAQPDRETIARANKEGVTLLATTDSTFAVVGKLWSLGLGDGY